MLHPTEPTFTSRPALGFNVSRSLSTVRGHQHSSLPCAASQPPPPASKWPRTLFLTCPYRKPLLHIVMVTGRFLLTCHTFHHPTSMSMRRALAFEVPRSPFSFHIAITTLFRCALLHRVFSTSKCPQPAFADVPCRTPRSAYCNCRTQLFF
jgi:hypothetical protein